MGLKELAVKFAKKRFRHLQQIDTDFLFETQHLDFDDENFWKHEIVQGLPEFSVALIAENYFNIKNRNHYSDQEIFSQIADQRNQSIQIEPKYSTPNDLVDFIVKQLKVEFNNDFNNNFRIGENGFTVNHIREIVYNVESELSKENDERPKFEKAFNINSDDLERTNKKTKRKKQAKDYGKLWLGALIMGGVVLISGLTGSVLVLIIFGLITGIILSQTLFKGLDV
jgi:hypothetical protein